MAVLASPLVSISSLDIGRLMISAMVSICLDLSPIPLAINIARNLPICGLLALASGSFICGGCSVAFGNTR